MDVLSGVMQSYRTQYEYYLTQADSRVANWFLMDAYTPTLLITLLYIVFVLIAPKFMEKRSPFRFRWTLFLYNTGLVALNFHIFFEIVTASTKLNYSYSCQPVHYGSNPDELRIAKALWWYYFSKCVEFLDTVFFILRKKNEQVSFLHVYHHATMFPIWWIGVKWVPGGQSFFGAMLNSFIHVLMYTYYGISALGPEYQKYLWWKKYLTTIQLVQFVLGMVHALWALYFGCEFPRWMGWALVIYGLSILTLFLNFYYNAYIKKKRLYNRSENGKTSREAMTKQNGQHSRSNGHLRKNN